MGTGCFYDRGYTHFGLDVSDENPRGRALYERLGMQARKRKPFALPSAGVPAAWKMELALTGCETPAPYTPRSKST